MRKRNFILTSAVAFALFLAVEAFPQQGGGQGGGAAKGGGAQGGGAQGGGAAKGGQNANNGQQQTPGALTGQVVSATTGEPLRKVSLTLQPQGRGGGGTNAGGGGPAATTSDQSGNFKFASVQPGTYQLSGERTGYVRGVHGEDRPGQQATPITIAANQTQGGISFKLVPHSVITGRVYDLDGDPVQNAEVTVLHYSYPRGQRQMTNVANANTNDLGEYRVANLPPGRYYVRASDRGALSAIRNLIGNDGGRGRGNIGDLVGRGGRGNILEQILGVSAVDPEAYVTTYYPRTTEPSGATPLNLVPGSETRGIDIGLLKGRLYSISGVVEGMPLPTVQPAQAAQTNNKGGKGNNNNKGGKGKGGDQGGNQTQVSLTPRTVGQQQNGIEQLLGGQAQVNADGTFQLKGVRPGAYYLMAQSRGPNNSRYSGRMPVDVTSGEVTGVRVRLSPPLEVSGRISPEKPDAELKMQQVRVNFVPSVQQGGRGGGNQARTDTDAEGKFKSTLDMDTYTVELQGANNYYLKSVKLAGQPLENNILDLNFSGAVLDVVLAKDSGAITGKVEKSNGDPVANARVTVVPANNSPRRDLYKSATSATDGTYTISNLPPGSYRVFAWEEVEQNAWMDQDFRRPFDGQGSNADIRDTNGVTVNLRVIRREQVAAIQ